VAVDDGGNATTSADPTGGSAAWKTRRLDHEPSLRAVSCPSTSMCAAVGLGGRIATSTAPTGGAAAWRVIKVASEHYAPNLNGVSCPSRKLCAAVGFGGVVTSTRPTGGASAWTRTEVGGNHNFLAASCPSRLLCVAVDDGGRAIVGTPSPPNTKIIEKAVDSRERRARFWFKAVGGVGSSIFVCKLDDKSYRDCSSPKAYRHLGVGRHTFKVRAIDTRGKRDPTPARKRFEIDR
jgi:hypothetical protein